MDIVPYIDNTKKHHFLNWIDFNTVKNTQCIVSNLILESKIDFVRDVVLSNPYIVVAANFPLRAWNCITALQDKGYWKVAFDVVAFSSLFFPLYGPKAAILIDLASEAINVYIKMNHDCRTRGSLSFWRWSNCGLEKIKSFFRNESENKEIDCTIRENALKMLGLSVEEAEDRLILDERYQDLYKVLNKRILKVKRSQLLVKEIEKILKQVQKSYHTLTT